MQGITGHEMSQIAFEQLGVEVDFSSIDHVIAWNIARETSDLPSVAMERMLTGINEFVGGTEIEKAFIRFCLKDHDWKTHNTAFWIDIARRWWRDNYKRFGYNGPGLAGYDEGVEPNP